MRRLMILVLASLVGCSETPTRDYSFDIRSVEESVASLKEQVESLKAAQAQRVLLDNESIILNPADEGFSIVETPYGQLAAQIIGVTGHANGSRVKIKLGNTTAASLKDVRCFAQWGETDSKGTPVYVAGRGVSRKIAKTIPNGSWMESALDLADVPPARLGFVKLSLCSADSISLNVAS